MTEQKKKKNTEKEKETQKPRQRQKQLKSKKALSLAKAKIAPAKIKKTPGPKAVTEALKKPPRVYKQRTPKPREKISQKSVSIEKKLKTLPAKAIGVVEEPQASVSGRVSAPQTTVVEKPKPPLVKPPEQKRPEPKIIQKELVEKKRPLVEEKGVLALKELELQLPLTVKDLAVRLQEKPSLLIKNLMDMGILVGINQNLDKAAVEKICQKYNYRVKKAPGKEELILGLHRAPDSSSDLKPRPPVVTFMGHVDHGKTSLLDAIRKTKVAESEYGGITQHIGAYRVHLPGGDITFLDTPGHEAFTAMRAHGANITDLVVLVVAADDGIMPQTVEAIDHARAAGVPIIVALNKIDKPQANIDRVKKQLSEYNLTAEDWSGKTITVPVSAKTGTGIEDLLEMILLEAQMLELKANPKRLASGVVIEAKLSKGRGPVSTLLIQNGTLRLNQNIIVGKFYGKIRAMFDDRGRSITETSPSYPVEVLGISGVPLAGEQFFTVQDEKEARELAVLRQEKEKQEQVKTIKRISLEELHAQIQAGKIKELKLIIKADVQGSIEAIKNTLEKLNVSEIKLEVIHAGVGSINFSDVILAAASNALVLGFNVATDELAKESAVKEGVDVRTYNIIYELANDIKAAVEGMLEPKLKKVFLGRAEVKKVFKLTRHGTVAGCLVTKGKIMRTGVVNLVRNGQVIFEGKLSSLKRFKDDVREVAEGFECGIAIAGFDAWQEGDTVEAFEIEKIARKL